MLTGLAAGILWALDTVILGIALSMSEFMSTAQTLVLAPLVSTFLHDAASSLWMLLYMGIRRQYRQVLQALRTRSGRFIMLGALLGGPVGMSGYVAAIHYIGPGYTAVISSMYPALGTLFSYIFLKEKMSLRQVLGLTVSILGVVIMSYAPGGSVNRLGLGIFCALLCCIGWASEAVICAYGLKDPNITDEQALQIRQVVSALCYSIVILNVIQGWDFTIAILPSMATVVVAAAALAGTASYICYYRAIAHIGPTKAMTLNITYSAWAIVFALLLLKQVPDGKSILCAIMILAGSITASKK